MIQPGQPHPGCHKCPGFEGCHCQYTQGKAPGEELQQAQKDMDETTKRLEEEEFAQVAVWIGAFFCH